MTHLMSVRHHMEMIRRRSNAKALAEDATKTDVRHREKLAVIWSAEHPGESFTAPIPGYLGKLLEGHPCQN